MQINEIEEKIKMIEEALEKGNPLYINNRPMSVFEMVQAKWDAWKLLKEETLKKEQLNMSLLYQRMR